MLQTHLVKRWKLVRDTCKYQNVEKVEIEVHLKIKHPWCTYIVSYIKCYSYHNQARLMKKWRSICFRDKTLGWSNTKKTKATPTGLLVVFSWKILKLEDKQILHAGFISASSDHISIHIPCHVHVTISIQNESHFRRHILPLRAIRVPQRRFQFLCRQSIFQVWNHLGNVLLGHRKGIKLVVIGVVLPELAPHQHGYLEEVATLHYRWCGPGT